MNTPIFIGVVLIQQFAIWQIAESITSEKF
ncbi:hypothetical protein HNR32_002574 [Pectinatus brassicae]|uniref:Uncharacterized protein n=1 Tax=Pectinatus brassicae TaxID=862415 RepID=A0A840UTF3_9FIRM|nr:hypothetical protein [Pectinatus brassicae]